MTSPYSRYSTRQTPQSQPIPGSTQVANSAGGYAFQLDDWGRLDRFLILGSEGGTYYIQEKELTVQNADVVRRCIAVDGVRVVNRIVEISDSGRAARNDPALFALAMAISFGDAATKRLAGDSLPKVARIGTHLFHFAQYAQNMRGWGRGLKRAIANWYDNSQRDLGYQLVKYQQRDGWGHRDLIQLSHPKAHGELYSWVLGSNYEKRVDTNFRKHEPVEKPFAIPDHKTIQGMLELHGNFPNQFETPQAVKTAAQIIVDHRLPREAVPTHMLNSAEIWEALLETDMGYEAMVRNLGNMSKVGLLKTMSAAASKVVNRLADEEGIKRSRLHPIKILVGMKTYQQGHGVRGSNSWDVVPQIVDALDGAFYKAFQNVEPTGKRMMLALDVSGSMGTPLMGLNTLTCRDGSAAMALVTSKTEPNHMFTCFASGNHPTQWGSRYNTGIRELDLSNRQRLDDVLKVTANIPFGGTDCALPMLYASEKNLEIDSFVIYTDSETWAGNVHPTQALQQYRQKTGIPASLVVVGMVSNGFSIADPNDSKMLDVVGFDTATPEVIANFQRE